VWLPLDTNGSNDGYIILYGKMPSQTNAHSLHLIISLFSGSRRIGHVKALMQYKPDTSWQLRFNSCSPGESGLALCLSGSFPLPVPRKELLEITGTRFYRPDALPINQPTVSKQWWKLSLVNCETNHVTIQCLPQQISSDSTKTHALGLFPSHIHHGFDRAPKDTRGKQWGLLATAN